MFIIAQTPIFVPGQPVIGGFNDGTDFIEGTVGTSSGTNNWPAAETPQLAIDGTSAKYLNFIELNAGLVVSVGATPRCICSAQIWTANDAEERDPSSIEIYGSNTAHPGGSFAMSNYTLLYAGGLNLPALRNPGGILDDNASQTINFTQTSPCFTEFLITFPTIKDQSLTNSMQIGDIQLFVDNCTTCNANTPIFIK